MQIDLKMTSVTVNQIILKVWRLSRITLLSSSFANSLKRSSLSPTQISISITLSYTYYFYALIILTYAIFMYQPFLLAHVLTYLRIYITYLHWYFFHLLVYSSLCSFDSFIICPYIILPHSFERFSVYLYLFLLHVFYFGVSLLIPTGRRGRFGIPRGFGKEADCGGLGSRQEVLVDDTRYRSRNNSVGAQVRRKWEIFGYRRIDNNDHSLSRNTGLGHAQHRLRTGRYLVPGSWVSKLRPG